MTAAELLSVTCKLRNLSYVLSMKKSSINKRHAARQELMKESLKKTNWELSQVTDMSMHVAEECIQLKKSTDAKVRQTTKIAERSDALSKA